MALRGSSPDLERAIKKGKRTSTETRRTLFFGQIGIQTVNKEGRSGKNTSEEGKKKEKNLSPGKHKPVESIPRSR